MCLSVCDSKSRQSKGRVQNPEARLVYLKVILHGDCNLKYRNKMCHDILSAEKVRVKEWKVQRGQNWQYVSGLVIVW